MDDEIVFLGSKSPSSAQRPVTGIVLHIEGQESGENYSMTFRKANTSVVHIGRRPGFEPSRSQDLEQGNAMFRCAVVSRKHAKIAFSDSGHAYLIDLNSHHGTFIRKAGERHSRKIGTETPTMLTDGDVITFGKEVGKGDESVGPIVARLELLHAGKTIATPAPIKPLIVPSPSTPSSSTDKSSLPKPASSGGRYGINKSPSSSSDDSYSSHSDMYSDIEEISPPTSSLKPAAPSVSRSQSQSGDQSNSSSLGQAFSVLKRLLPPTHTPSNLSRLPSVTEIIERPLSLSSFFLGLQSGQPPSEYTPSSPSFSPSSPFLFGSPVSPPFDDLVDLPVPLGYGDPMDPEHEDQPAEEIASSAGQSNKSRSNSPMDLASPSPAPPEVVVTRSLSIPPPLSSPPLSFPLSPLIPTLVQPPSQQPVAAVAIQPANMDIPLVNSPEGSSSRSGASSPTVELLDSVIPFGSATGVADVGAASTAAATSNVVPAQLKQIEDSIASLKADVGKLQAHRKKYKARFNANVGVISQKLNEFDDRLSEVNAEYLVLSNQVENVVQVEVPDLNGQLEAMQERIDEFMDEREDMDKEREDMEKAKEEAMNIDKDILIKRFDAALEEMKEFTSSMNKQMQEELAIVKAVREATQAQLVQMQEEQAKAKVANEVCFLSQMSSERRFTADPTLPPQTPVLTSLKRKRDDIDQNEDEAVDETQGRDEHEPQGKLILAATKSDETTLYTAPAVDVEANAGKDKDVAVDGDKVPRASVELVEVSMTRAPDSPPPRKRVRRLASVVAQTATAVTIGAVVTWSALAFS